MNVLSLEDTGSRIDTGAEKQTAKQTRWFSFGWKAALRAATRTCHDRSYRASVSVAKDVVVRSRSIGRHAAAVLAWSASVELEWIRQFIPVMHVLRAVPDWLALVLWLWKIPEVRKWLYYQRSTVIVYLLTFLLYTPFNNVVKVIFWQSSSSCYQVMFVLFNSLFTGLDDLSQASQKSKNRCRLCSFFLTHSKNSSNIHISSQNSLLDFFPFSVWVFRCNLVAGQSILAQVSTATWPVE